MPQPFMDVRVYVDGFNLYFSMKDKEWRKYYWLDVYALGIKLVQKAKTGKYLHPNQTVNSVRYFTSRVGGNRKKAGRQNAYLEALQAHNERLQRNLTISYGAYQLKPFTCEHCGREIQLPVEKKTDVNLATDLLVDAFFNKFKTAIVVSGDSDLTGPVRAVKELFPEKSVIVAVPPDRFSKDLTSAAHRFLLIDERLLRQCQLPEQVYRADNYPLCRPALWK